MENITIKDYEIFNDAISNINRMTDNLTKDIDSIANEVNTLDENFFAGPIRDSFFNSFNLLNNEIHISSNSFNVLESGLLEQYSESYASADANVSNKVGSV